MTEYDFTLRFALSSEERVMDEVLDRLHRAGCDDALIGIGQPGRIALDFTRESDSARDAILSAIANVLQAVPGAQLIEVAPDFVGVSDIAEIVGCSRQNIRQLMLSQSSGAPAPLHESTSALWHLASVLEWLSAEKGYVLDDRLMETAHAAMRVNAAAQALRADRQTQREVRALLA